MGRSLTSVVCLTAALAGAGCASAPEPETAATAESAPIAIGERPTDRAQDRATERTATPAPAGETAVATEPMAGAPATVAAMPAAPSEVPLVFARSEAIEHEWTAGDGRRMHVVFRLSYSARTPDVEAAAESVHANWQAAVKRARAVCETLVPRDELNQRGCEAMLCQQLSDVLFGERDARVGTVERVIWDRLVWR